METQCNIFTVDLIRYSNNYWRNQTPVTSTVTVLIALFAGHHCADEDTARTKEDTCSVSGEANGDTTQTVKINVCSEPERGKLGSFVTAQLPNRTERIDHLRK